MKALELAREKGTDKQLLRKKFLDLRPPSLAAPAVPPTRPAPVPSPINLPEGPPEGPPPGELGGAVGQRFNIFL